MFTLCCAICVEAFQENCSHQNRSKSRKKSVTTRRDDRLLIRQSLQDGKKSSSEIAAAFLSMEGKLLSASTVKRKLLETQKLDCWKIGQMCCGFDESNSEVCFTLVYSFLLLSSTDRQKFKYDKCKKKALT